MFNSNRAPNPGALAANFLTAKKLLIAALVLQTAFFCFFVYKANGDWLRGDNPLYEIPAWNLAAGNGLSFARDEFDDPFLTDLHHAAHPEKVDSRFVPATTLPVGYSLFLAAIYSVFGRNEFAAVSANGFLLIAAIVAMYFLVRRVFGESREALIAMALVAVFPFWAFWAALILSDTLHFTLLTFFALIFFVEKPSARRVVLAGLVLGLAAVVRPYALLLPFALFAGGWWFRNQTFDWRKTAIVLVLCWSVIGVWAARNYYQFGQPMLTSMGLGYGVWISTYKEIFTDDLNELELTKQLPADIKDYHLNADNKRILNIAIERIKQNPARHVLVTITNIPRLWISLGGGNFPFAGKVGLIIYLGGMLILTVAGLFFARKARNPVIVGATVIVLYYTLFFVPLGVEGRFVIPARFFSFLLIAIAVSQLLKRFLPGAFPETVEI